MTNANSTSGFFQKNITSGTRVVRVTANDASGPFNARLFVNGGEDATWTVRKAKTLAGAEKQAAKMLAR